MSDQPPLQNATPVADVPPAVDSSLLLPMKEYLGSRLEAEFGSDGRINIKVENCSNVGLWLDGEVMRRLIDFWMLGQQVLILRKSASGTEANEAEKMRATSPGARKA